MFDNLSNKIKAQIIGYVLASLGLVAGLAWNDAIKSFIDHFYPVSQGTGIPVKFTYAIVMTLVVVIVGIYLNREEKQ